MTFLHRQPFAFIFLFALLLRFGYMIDIHDTPLWRWHEWKQSDMDTFLTVARQVQEQGILVPRPYHPYHAAHESTGTREQWERWLGGEHAFFRIPGYYYLLALILTLSGGSLLAVMLVHAVLGAGHAMLLGLIGSRMMGPRASIIIGLLAATYGPFIGAETMILREGPGLFLAAAGLYLVLRALGHTTEAPSRGWWVGWLGTGVVLGIGGLIKETGLVLFGSIWLWAVMQCWRRRNPLPRLIPWILLCGFLVPFAPLVLRNVLVGAPPVTSSTIFAWNVAVANAIDNSSHGVELQTPPSVAGVMTGSNARLLDVIRLTWQNYEGQHARFFANWWGRFKVILSNVEVPDNVSYDFLVLHSKLLAVLPRFVCIWLPAALALVLLGWRWMLIRKGPVLDADASSSKETDSFAPFTPRTLSLILIALLSHGTLLSLGFVGSRYRLVIVPFLILLAGWTLVQATLWILEHKVQKFLSLCAALVFLSLLWHLWPTQPELQASTIRPNDFSLAAAFLILQDDAAGARVELEQGFRYCSGLPATPEALRRKCSQPLAELWIDFFGEAPDLRRGADSPAGS